MHRRATALALAVLMFLPTATLTAGLPPVTETTGLEDSTARIPGLDGGWNSTGRVLVPAGSVVTNVSMRLDGEKERGNLTATYPPFEGGVPDNTTLNGTGLTLDTYNFSALYTTDDEMRAADLSGVIVENGARLAPAGRRFTGAGGGEWRYRMPVNLTDPMSVEYSPSESLLLYHFEEGAGQKANDNAGPRYGILSGAQWTSDSRFGRYAVLLNSPGAMIDVDEPGGGAIDPQSNFYLEGSLELWFRPLNTHSPGRGQMVLAAYGYVDAGNNFIPSMLLSLENNGRLVAAIIATNGTGTYNFVLSSNTTVWSNAVWYHAAVKWANGIRLYVNGTIEGFAAYNNTWSFHDFYAGPGAGWSFGGTPGNGFNSFKGYLDEIRLTRSNLNGGPVGGPIRYNVPPDRVNEPVTTRALFPAGHIANATKEVRVTNESGVEIPSQVLAQGAAGGAVWADIAFLANFSPSADYRRAGPTYYIWYGNPQAEAPTYISDLRLSGDLKGDARVDNSYLSTTVGKNRNGAYLDRTTTFNMGPIAAWDYIAKVAGEPVTQDPPDWSVVTAGPVVLVLEANARPGSNAYSARFTFYSMNPRIDIVKKPPPGGFSYALLDKQSTAQPQPLLVSLNDYEVRGENMVAQPGSNTSFTTWGGTFTYLFKDLSPSLAGGAALFWARPGISSQIWTTLAGSEDVALGRYYDPSSGTTTDTLSGEFSYTHIFVASASAGEARSRNDRGWYYPLAASAGPEEMPCVRNGTMTSPVITNPGILLTTIFDGRDIWDGGGGGLNFELVDDSGAVVYSPPQQGNPGGIYLDPVQHPRFRMRVSLFSKDGLISPILYRWGLVHGIGGTIDRMETDWLYTNTTALPGRGITLTAPETPQVLIGNQSDGVNLTGFDRGDHRAVASAIAPSGRVLVVYEDYDMNGPWPFQISTIEIRLYRQDGELVNRFSYRPPSQPPSDIVLYQSGLAAVADSGGSFLVAFGTLDLYDWKAALNLLPLDPEGNPAGAQYALRTLPSAMPVGPDLFYDGQDALLATWYEPAWLQGYPYFSLAAQLLRFDLTAPLSNQFSITDRVQRLQGWELVNHPGVPLVTASFETGKGVTVAWADGARGNSDSDIYMRRFDMRGKPLGPELPLAAGVGVQNSPSIIRDADGNLVAAWSDSPAGSIWNSLNFPSRVHLRKFSPDGLMLSGDVSDPTTMSQGTPRLGLLPSGELLLIWNNQSRLLNSFTDISYRKFTPDLQPAGGGGVLAVAENFQLPLDVRFYANGTVRAVWYDNRNYTNNFMPPLQYDSLLFYKAVSFGVSEGGFLTSIINLGFDPLFNDRILVNGSGLLPGKNFDLWFATGDRPDLADGREYHFSADLRGAELGRYLRIRGLFVANGSGPVPYLRFLNDIFTVARPAGSYTSPVIEAPGEALETRVSWSGTVSGNDRIAVWASPDDGNTWYPAPAGLPVVFDPGDWGFRFRVNLTSINGTSRPVISDLNITIVYGNLPYKVTLDIGDDGTPEWNMTDTLYPDPDGVALSGDDLVRGFNRYLDAHRGDAVNGTVAVPLNFSAESAGGVRVANLSVAYDVMPSASPASPADGALIRGPVKLEWRVDDPDTSPDSITYDLYLDAGNATTLNRSGLTGLNYTLTGLKEGTYRWKVVPHDGVAAGRFNGTPRSFRVLANTLPEAVLLSPANGSLLNTPLVAFAWNGSDRDGQPLTYRMVLTQLLPPGTGNRTERLVNATSVTLLLLPGFSYEWSVIPGDGIEDGICLNGTWRFTINSTATISNRPPSITPIPKIKLEAGRETSINLSQYGSDPDDDSGMLAWSVVNLSGQAPVTASISGTVLKVGGTRRGTYQLQLRLSDPHGAHADTTVAVEVAEAGGGGTGTNSPATVAAIAGVAVLLVALIGAAAFAAARKRRKPAGETAPQTGSEATRQGEAERATASSAPSPTAPPSPPPEPVPPVRAAVHAAPAEKGEDSGGVTASAVAKTAAPDFSLNEVFIIYRDGRLLHHISREMRPEGDDMILTSMLTALQDFVKEGLARGDAAPLGSMEYGKNKILIERGLYVIVAAVISGKEPEGLREELAETLKNIEADLAAVLPQWDGDVSMVAGVRKHAVNLTKFRPAATGADEKVTIDVKLLTELEFYQGFVRFKAAVKNQTPTVVTDLTLKLIYNEEALRLDRLEPAYRIHGREVEIGNIGPREKKTVAFYLDPQICTESYIDGTLTFKDATGELRTATMKRKLVSVVCPIMYTDENVNPAMLKRMVADELDQRDSKVFRMPPAVSPEKAFDVVKRAVQGHDVRHIRDYIEKDPFVGEAWYYGKTKGRNDRLVIRATVRKDTSSVEFFVASGSILVVTGLLAELKNDLNGELKRERMAVEKPLEQILDEDLKQRIRGGGLLIEKYAESEAATGDTEVKR